MKAVLLFTTIAVCLVAQNNMLVGTSNRSGSATSNDAGSILNIGAHTLEAWIKIKPYWNGQTFDQLPTTRRIIMGFSDGSSSSWIGPFQLIMIGNNLQYSIGNGQDGQAMSILSSTKTNWNYDEWYHVAATWDGTTNSGSMKIYVNGVLDNVGTSSVATLGPNSGTQHQGFRVGGPGGGHHNFYGRLDEARVWNTALNNDQINNYLSSEIDPLTPGLALYYRFNENSGSVVNNLVGNFLNGTTSNGRTTSDVPFQVDNTNNTGLGSWTEIGSGQMYTDDNIGIGTTDLSTYKLNVNGNTKFTGTGGANGFVIGKDNSDTKLSSRLFFENSVTGKSTAIHNNDNKFLFTVNATAGTSTGIPVLELGENDITARQNLIMNAKYLQFIGADVTPENTMMGLYRNNGQLNIQSWGNVGIRLDSDNNDSDTRAFNIYSNASNTSIFHVSEKGNVGIGTNTASEALHVAGNGYFTGNIGIGTSGQVDLLYLKSTTTDARQVIDGANGFDAELKFASNGAIKHTLGYDSASDKFILGTSNVDNGVIFSANTSGLQVNGLLTSNGFSTGSGIRNLTFSTETNISSNALHRLSIASTNGAFAFNNDNGELFRIKENGNVGIGVTNPNYRLTVDGTIAARKVKVTTETWADFVFEDGYDLPSLESTEEFIKENKHLPNIPSETEVKRNGVDIGDMQVKLLQKIEELTLHVIRLNKENKQLKSEFKTFKEGN